MRGDLFAGIAVTHLDVALRWYQQLFGAPPSFFPNEREAVWQLGEHRYVFIEVRPDHAGHARHLVFVDDLDEVVAQLSRQGLEAADLETSSNGVRKAAYRDPDGNEFGLGGVVKEGAR